MLSCCLYDTSQTFKSHYAKVILFVINLFCSIKQQKSSLNALPVVQCVDGCVCGGGWVCVCECALWVGGWWRGCSGMHACVSVSTNNLKKLWLLTFCVLIVAVRIAWSVQLQYHGLSNPGFSSLKVERFFCFPKSSESILGSTQPSIYGVQQAHYPGVKGPCL
jgi:hypothetical protein